jgi:hypothetical protein
MGGAIHRCKNIPLYRNSELSYPFVTSSLSEGRIAIVTKGGVSGGGRGLRRAGGLSRVHDGRGLAYGKIVWS